MSIQAIQKDTSVDYIQSLFLKAGAPQKEVEQCDIQRVQEGGLSITFRIEFPGNKICYIKFCEKEGARGGPFLKHLLPINCSHTREHAEKRRRFIRKVLDNIATHHRATMIPRAMYFDLSGDSMSVEKLKREQGSFAEYRVVPGEGPPCLTGMVATLWEGFDIKHLPTLSKGRVNVHDPIHYAPEMIFQCSALLGELERTSTTFLQSFIQTKALQSTKTPSELQRGLEKKLQHEQRYPLGYSFLMEDFLLAVGVSLSGDRKTLLKLRGEAILSSIEKVCIGEFGCSDIDALQNDFLIQDPTTDSSQTDDFSKQVFAAEREGWWTEEEREKAKRLTQLGEAKKMAEAFMTAPDQVLDLISFLEDFKETYERIDALKKTIVPQDAHPFNFFQNQVDGKVSMLDLEDMSMGVRFNDLSTVIIYKTIRGYIDQKITEEAALVLIKAAIRGYNSEASIKLTEEELSIMMDYSVAVFLNHPQQFGVILNLDKKNLCRYNPAFSINSFFSLFNKHRRISEAWKNRFHEEIT